MKIQETFCKKRGICFMSASCFLDMDFLHEKMNVKQTETGQPHALTINTTIFRTENEGHERLKWHGLIPRAFDNRVSESEWVNETWDRKEMRSRGCILHQVCLWEQNVCVKNPGLLVLHINCHFRWYLSSWEQYSVIWKEHGRRRTLKQELHRIKLKIKELESRYRNRRMT